MSGARILVVEDNLDNMILISDVLASLQYEVLQAFDGVQGLKMADEQRPDVILMDMSLPHIDGWAATQNLKANPELCSIPIIAVTAHAMVGDRERALAVGCDDYISKPINLRDLASKLRQFTS